MKLVFDIETDGLLDEATKVHSLVIRNPETGERVSCANEIGYFSIDYGLELLSKADVLIGHNIQTYDIPALRKLYPTFNPKGLVRDTLILSRLIWTDLTESDHLRVRKDNKFPARLIGRHSLKAWGHRLGVYKSDFHETTDWKNWTTEMQNYCEQDVEVNVALWSLIEKQEYAEDAIQLEHDFQTVIFLQERHGFAFDKEKAAALYAKLVQRKTELTTELQTAFPPRIEEMKMPQFWVGETPFGTSEFKTKGEARKSGAKNIHAGPLRKKTIPFNPGSRDQIAARLMEKGWEPVKFTEGNKPQVDESVLETLPYPEAKLLNEYLLVGKRIGQLAEGDNAWMKLERNGRIHGRVVTNGAVSGRCTHIAPNVAQTPTVRAPYGKECRELFHADPGMVQVGADASGLELRMLGHFVARYDGGEYVKLVTEGDVHTANQLAAGLATRDMAKTFIYAFCYGAGDEKIGVTVGGPTDEEIALYRKTEKRRWSFAVRMLQKQKRVPDARTVATLVKGGVLKAQFLEKTPALGKLKDAVTAAVKARGFIKGLDGRKLHSRSAHSALNLLLQSAGALVMKRAAVILYQHTQTKGWQHGTDFAFLANIHDEFQMQCRPELAEELGLLAVQSIKEAGEAFGLRCPLSGEFKVGSNWAECH